MSALGDVAASLRSDRGRLRDHNQDFVACHEPAGPEDAAQHGWLYILADGAGGMDAGEVASRYATERTLHHYLTNDGEGQWGQRLRSAMLAANTELRELAAHNGDKNRMATTMVAAVVHDGRATLGNVGDSRGYLWHEGELKQITKDQSLVARLLEEGVITAEEATHHPRRNIILGSLGADRSPQIDLYDLELAAGDALVLCSDGLIRHVSDDEIASAVSLYEPAVAADALIELANSRGGEDNISVIVLRPGTTDDRRPTTDDRRPTTAVSGQPSVVSRQSSAVANGRLLWFYTTFLCLLEAALIILVWYVLQS